MNLVGARLTPFQPGSDHLTDNAPGDQPEAKAGEQGEYRGEQVSGHWVAPLNAGRGGFGALVNVDRPVELFERHHIAGAMGFPRAVDVGSRVDNPHW